MKDIGKICPVAALALSLTIVPPATALAEEATGDTADQSEKIALTETTQQSDSAESVAGIQMEAGSVAKQAIASPLPEMPAATEAADVPATTSVVEDDSQSDSSAADAADQPAEPTQADTDARDEQEKAAEEPQEEPSVAAAKAPAKVEADNASNELPQAAAPDEISQTGIYVSEAGDDSADGKTVDTAYKTLQTAINKCPEGGTVYIVGTYKTPDKQTVNINKSMTLAGYTQNGVKAELHEGTGVQYYLLIGNNIDVKIKDLVIDGENLGHGRLIMVTLVRGVTHKTTLTLDNAEVRNYVGHALINTDNGTNNDVLIIKDSLIHDFKGSYHSMSSAIMSFSSVKAYNSKFYNNDGSYTWPVSGGAIRIQGGQTGEFTNCDFYNNSQHLGGAIYNSGTLTLTNCNFWNNHAAAHYTQGVKDYYGSDMADWQDNGGAIYNAGTATMTGGSVIGNDARSNGGGIYNRDGKAIFTLNGVEIDNNTAGTSGDDIFNRAGGTITFEAVDTSKKLDNHPCTDAIKAWYDDSEGTRWNAHDVDKVHVVEVQPGTYKGDALALKAAHDTGAYRILYRTQNDDGTYSEPTQEGGIILAPISSDAVSVDHEALDERLAKQGYRLASADPAEFAVEKVYNGDIDDCYTVLLTYNATGAYQIYYRTQNADGTYADPVKYGELVYSPLGGDAVAVDHRALDEELAGKGYEFSGQDPTDLVIAQKYCGNPDEAYSIVLSYDIKKEPEKPDTEKPSAPEEPAAAPEEQVAAKKPAAAQKALPKAGQSSALPETGDSQSGAGLISLLGMAAVGLAAALKRWLRSGN